MTKLRSRTVRIAGHPADIRLEAPMWEALHDVAHKKRISVVDLVDEIDRERGHQGLAAGIRDYIIAYYRESARRALECQKDEIERMIVACVKRLSKSNPAALARAILETLWEGYEVTRRPDVIPIRGNHDQE